MSLLSSIFRPMFRGATAVAKVSDRAYGQINLTGSVQHQLKDKLKHDVYQRYTEAASALSGHLVEGVEVKLKAGLSGEYAQLTFENAKGKVEKVALQNRTSVESEQAYLQSALETAQLRKTIDSEASLHSSLKRSESGNLKTYIEAIIAHNKDLPENTTVKLKRAMGTGHKSVHFNIPSVLGGNKAYTIHITKEPGESNAAFIERAFNHAKAVSQNDQRQFAAVAARQAQAEAAAVAARRGAPTAVNPVSTPPPPTNPAATVVPLPEPASHVGNAAAGTHPPVDANPAGQAAPEVVTNPVSTPPTTTPAAAAEVPSSSPATSSTSSNTSALGVKHVAGALAGGGAVAGLTAFGLNQLP